MTDAQFECLFYVLERIANSLDSISGHTFTVAGGFDTVTDDEGLETTVLNIWKEGESE